MKPAESDVTVVSALEPGIYEGIGHDEYHALPYISNGYLGKLEECPAAAKIVTGDAPNLLFGRVSHAYILEGIKPTVMPEDTPARPSARSLGAKKPSQTTLDAIEFWKKWDAEHEGQDVILNEDWEVIQAMREAVLAHPFAKELLVDGLAETTVIWDEAETNIRCKCRPDWRPRAGAGVVIDLKTTSDASPKSFRSSVTNFGYARQAAFYLDGMSAASGERFDLFAFIAVEKKPPYRVEIYTLDDDFLFFGRNQYKSLLFIEERCRAEKFWPHYRYAEPTTLSIPGYLKYEEGLK